MRQQITFMTYMTFAERMVIYILCMLVRIFRLPSYVYAVYWISSSGPVSYTMYGLAMQSRYEFDLPSMLRNWFHFLHGPRIILGLFWLLMLALEITVILVVNHNAILK